MTLPKILQDNLSIPVIGAPLFLVSGPETLITAIPEIPGPLERGYVVINKI